MSDTKKTKKLVGSNGTGTDRQYTFKLASAKDGLSVMAEYSALTIAAMPKILALIAAYTDANAGVDDEENPVIFSMIARELHEGDGPVLGCVRILPQILTAARIFDLCKIFLAGAEIDGEVCDAEGMCDLFARRPHEAYVALFWAVNANYPDYLGPLLGALETEGDMMDPNVAEK